MFFWYFIRIFVVQNITINMELIVGSTALKHHFPDFNRVPKDLDIMVPDASIYKSSPEVEYLENPLIFNHVKEGQKYIDPDLLLTLKMSHLFFDIRWDKHMWDVQFLLEQGCKYDINIMMGQFEYWAGFQKRYKRSDLEMTKEKFFTNAVNYDEHEHDYLHTLITPTPAYQKILVDGEDVEISEDKFNALSFEEQLDVVREEVYVMAYERYKDKHFLVAYSKMLKKFIRQHAPVWMFPFVVENYIKLSRAKIDFITQIQKQLDYEPTRH